MYTVTGEDNNENANEQIREMITRESFASKNSLYKLACQCENTISPAFTIYQSNNQLLIQNLRKF